VKALILERSSAPLDVRRSELVGNSEKGWEAGCSASRKTPFKVGDSGGGKVRENRRGKMRRDGVVS